MSCTACQSEEQSQLPAEINIHPPVGLQNLDKPTVWAFPSLLICSNCGFSEFVLDEGELRSLRENLATEPSLRGPKSWK